MIHRFAHITEEGDESGAFQSSIVASHNNSGATATAESNPNVVTTTTTNTQESQSNNEPVQAELPAELVPLIESNAPSINMDDADLVRHMVPGMIDDDNQPLPENILKAIKQQNNTPEFFSSWEHSGSCYWCVEGGRKNNACLIFNSDVQPTVEQLFEMFFPKQFIVATIIPQTNIQLEQQRYRRTSYGEFLHWLGLWFLMATINGPDRSDFWSMTEVDCFVGPPLRLGGFMSRKWFDMILKALAITSRSPPAFRDRFWEVREILEAWNANMIEQFTPSSVSCLDKSMSTWTNKYSCPGWMFNEYHTVCCSLSGILWQMELMEGKDAPSQLVPKFNNLGKTVGLLLQVLEPIFGKGNMVVLDSGFCVLKGIVELKKRGVYASALIKKQKYWPKYIKGDAIKEYFDDKDVGDCDSWKGNMDEVPFHVYAMKEPDYVMSPMSTYGMNLRNGKEQKRKKFQYPEVVGNHFMYCHSVDDHNNKRHSPMSLEVIWATKFWPNHVFAFLLGVTKVNVNLAATYFCGQEPTGQIEFRKLLAKTSIYNTYYDENNDKTLDKERKHRESGHCLVTLPKNKKSWDHESSQQTVNIPNTNAFPAPKGYVPTAYVLQESISVLNALDITLHASRTIFQHRAEFSC